MRRPFVAGIAALVLTACGTPSIGSESTAGANIPQTTSTSLPTTSTSLLSDPDVISSGNLGVITQPNADGEFPPDLIVTCRGVGHFPLRALDQIESLDEADPGGMAEAIEPFLAGGEGQHWPQEGWQVLHASSDEALLVTKQDGSLSFMNLSNDGSGWQWAGASGGVEGCPIEFVYTDSVNPVSWTLDPSGPPLDEESTEVAVILNEVSCVDGREIGDRLLAPEIVMTETKVFMAFAAERPPGDAFNCPGNPDTPYVVELPAPLGDRTLMPGVELGIDLADYIEGE